ncbi:SIMPL domain-containing protein [Niallia sp. XMNu-256]|uniref:SIMPL domain-containing protein n=1 Tax=Niallia sp. XMNu-256 TaxID=3082444 RepID=UPI0030CF4830
MYLQQGQPFYPSNQFAHPKMGNTIIVEGEGTIKVKPDQAKVTLGVVTENMDVQKAQQENALISNSVIRALRDLGIEESSIQTASYTIFPRYDYVEGQSILRGYEVEHLLEVLVKDLDIIGRVYETAIRNGVNRSGDIDFIVSNQDFIYQEALKRALRMAFEKATVISQSIGARMNPVPNKVTEQNPQQNKVGRVLSAQAQTFQAEEIPPIQTGQISIRATVQVVYVYQ